MALNLITGPANAEKAGAVLDGFRAEVARGSEPLLVVPTLPDVDHYRRELAAGGAVFGVQILRFGWLVDEIARRCGVFGRAIGGLECERIAAAAIDGCELTELAAARGAAGGLGLARALVELAAELEEQRVDAGRFIVALRQWAAAEPAREAYAGELGALYGGYRDRLAALGRDDEPLRTARVVDALLEQPGRWGRTPVFLYGFDELTALQLDAVEALARGDAEITISLTHEAGRAVFSARAATYERLLAIAGPRHTTLPALRTHYATASREPLHHLERELFESDLEPAPLFGPASAPTVDPGAAIALLRGGGPRAEAELVAATRRGAAARRGLRARGGRGDRPPRGDRAPGRAGAARGRDLRRVRRARRRAPHRAGARPDRAAALRRRRRHRRRPAVSYLRTPGVVRQLDRVDRLEARARREGAATAAAARVLWERDQWPIEAIDRVAAAHGRGPGDLCRRLAAEASLLLAAPFRRASHVLAGPELLDARAAGALRGALRRLASLADADERLAPSAARARAHAGRARRVPAATRPAPAG